MVTDSYGVLGEGNLCKQVHRQTLTTLFLSEPDKYNQNPVELGSRVSKPLLFKSGMSVVWGLWLRNNICQNTYVTLTIMSHGLVSITSFLLYELLWGETSDISMIRFKLWEPVYYRNWRDKYDEGLLKPMRLLCFSWNVGYTMHVKVFQCNNDKYKQNQVLHSGVVVPRILESTGYNSALAPKMILIF